MGTETREMELTTMATILRPNQYPLGATQGIEQARMGTDGHGNAGDGINDNTDNLRPNQYPLGATQRIEQPRIARMGTETWEMMSSYSRWS